jgi:hypothetical protein
MYLTLDISRLHLRAPYYQHSEITLHNVHRIKAELFCKAEDKFRNELLLRFEVFMAVTMKNAVFWGTTPCGSCKNRHFGGLY